MYRIKFSHQYKKLNGESLAELKDVIPIELERQTKGFIDYDAEGIYKLPKKGIFLVLVFLGGYGTLFTTLRRHTPRKYEYYSNLIGEQFEVVIA